ncbi:MAG: hypothetical protein A2428_13535 [Bdellovibrionales bacterium RIFOXYC1_FULL_54_43]|nr:MAG: hypothetical protein A2428_13535 [Bdellovibrionales bacterium RIFOXYC1_FULL_54_43]OFZ83164.1 MAG: hypothetical protein A2603_00275 [Bdellovibrionales bacterium RIFOXYD1_FULL_55_31]
MTRSADATRSTCRSQENLSQRPIRCLVIQLARMGDTLQSLMALRAAKELYPALEIHFVARERFADAAKRVPWIDEVIVLPTDSLLGPIISGEVSERSGLKEIARWVAPLCGFRWDLIVNWTYSESSSFLTGILPARVKLGYSRQRDTTFSCADGWSHYIQAVVQGGIEQNIHLTDILTTQLLTALQIHFGEPADSGGAAVTSKHFFSAIPDEITVSEWHLRDRSKKWIAIQLGAAQPEKTWDAKNWAKLTEHILQRHPECRFVLLGGKGDQTRAKAFVDSLTRENRKHLIDVVGETDFELWARIVSDCNWVFSADTAAIHLASILGTRVLNVSVGPVRWTETGPYGNGHYVLSSAKPCSACKDRGVPAEHTCRNDVTPEGVYGAWSYGSSEWSHRRQLSIETHFARLGWSAELHSIAIHRSKIRDASAGGGVVFENLLHRQLEIANWTAMVIEHIGRTWYCGWTPGIGQELSRDTISPDLIKALRALEESSRVMIQACEKGARLATELHDKSRELRSQKVMSLQNRTELNILAGELERIDKLVNQLGKLHPPLRLFPQMFTVLMHNLRGDRLSELGLESASCYRQLGVGASQLKDWLQFTLKMARPVVLRPASELPVAAEMVPDTGNDLPRL